MRKYIAFLAAFMLCLTGCSGKTPSAADKIKGRKVANTVIEETSLPAETEEILSEGYIEGNRYIDETSGIAYDFDDDWTLSIKYRGEELEEDDPLFQSFFAGNNKTFQSLNIKYVELTEQERNEIRYLPADEQLDIVWEDKEYILEQFEQMGMVVESVEKVPVMFLGEETVGILYNYYAENVSYYMLQYVSLSLGDYSVVFTCGSPFENTTQELLSSFYAI